MRKKGKPNPEQKYFLLVVALEAVYLQNNNSPQEIPLCALATEKIIVRASNPGLFEPEQEISWSKNPHNDTVYHLGKVGVGTDASKEMLTVQGNIQVRETFDVSPICATNKELNLICLLVLCLYMKITTCLLV